MVDIVINIQKQTLLLCILTGVLLLIGNELLLKNKFQKFRTSHCDVYTSLKIESIRAIKCMTSVFNLTYKQELTSRMIPQCKPSKVGFISSNEDTLFTDICYRYGITQKKYIAISSSGRNLAETLTTDPADIVVRIPENESFSLVCPGIFTLDEIRKVNILPHPKILVLILKKTSNIHKRSEKKHTDPKNDFDQTQLIKSLLPKNVQQEKITSKTISVINKAFGTVLLEELFIPSLIILKRKLCWELRDIIFLKQMASGKMPTTYNRITQMNVYDFYYNNIINLMATNIQFREEVDYFTSLVSNFSNFCESSESEENPFIVQRSNWSDAFTLRKSDCIMMKMPREQVRITITKRSEVMVTEHQQFKKMSSDLYQLRIKNFKKYLNKIHTNRTTKGSNVQLTTFEKTVNQSHFHNEKQNFKNQSQAPQINSYVKHSRIADTISKGIHKSVIKPNSHVHESLKEKLSRAKTIGNNAHLDRSAKIPGNLPHKIEVQENVASNKLDSDTGNESLDVKSETKNNEEDNVEVNEEVEKLEIYTINVQNVGEIQKESISLSTLRKKTKPSKVKSKSVAVAIEPLFD